MKRLVHVFLATALTALLLAPPFGFPLAQAHDKAYADETRYWTYAGDKVVRENRDLYFSGYGPSWRTDSKINYSGNSLSASSNLIHVSDDSVDGIYEESSSCIGVETSCSCWLK